MRLIRTHQFALFSVSFMIGSLRLACGFASGLRHQQSSACLPLRKLRVPILYAVCGCCETEVAPAASGASQTGTSELPDGTSSGAHYGLPSGVRN